MDLGEPLTLQNDKLCFSAWSAGEGPLVMLLHGFPDLPQTWQHQVSALSEAGFRTVTVTNRGYEPQSLATDDDYQLTSLAGDVLAWLDQLEADKVHLVGHDWGASVAYAAAATAPHRFASLCTMAVPHTGRFATAMSRSLKQAWLSRYIMMFQIRGFAEGQLSRQDFRHVDTLWRRWSPGWDYNPALTREVRTRFAEPGICEAVLAWYRQGADTRTEAGKAARELAAQAVHVPTLALHGEKDGCIDPGVFRNSMLKEDFPAGLTVETVPDCGHFLHLERPETINKQLLGWLQSHPIKAAR